MTPYVEGLHFIHCCSECKLVVEHLLEMCLADILKLKRYIHFYIVIIFLVHTSHEYEGAQSPKDKNIFKAALFAIAKNLEKVQAWIKNIMKCTSNTLHLCSPLMITGLEGRRDKPGVGDSHIRTHI